MASTLGNFADQTRENRPLQIKVRQEVRLSFKELSFQIVHKSSLVDVSDGHKLCEETFTLLELTGSNVIVLNEIYDWSKQLHVRQPLRFKVNVFRDESAQVSITIMNPFARIDTRLNQDKRLIEEAVELFEATVLFLQQDVSLKSRTEDYF